MEKFDYGIGLLEKIKCYVSTRGLARNMPFHVGTSWHIKRHEKGQLIPAVWLLSPFAFLSVSGYTPMEFHTFRELEKIKGPPWKQVYIFGRNLTFHFTPMDILNPV